VVAYLYRNLAVAWLAMIPLLGLGPLVYGASVGDAVGPAMWWSGAFAAGYVYFRFRRKKIWPLYRNLRLPVFLLLGSFVAFGALAGLAARLVLP